MTHDHASNPQSVQTSGFWRSRYAIGLLVFGAVALLLACPRMHVFMHKGHGGHGGHGGGSGATGQGTGQNSDRG